MRNLVVVSLFMASAAACAIEAPDLTGIEAGASSSTKGTGGDNSSGSGGSDTTNGSGGASSGSGGSGNSGDNSTGSGGTGGGTGGASSTGSGGASSTGSGGASSTGSGGSGDQPDASAPGTGGGSMGSGGASMGSGGASVGSGGGGPIDAGVTKPDTGAGGSGSGGTTDAFKALNGFRLDDACSTINGTVCQHIDNKSNYHATKALTMAGDSTVYNVKLHFRGAVEPTIIGGGTKPDTAHPMYVKDGTPTDRTYETWFINISNPPATYFLNAQPKTGHVVYVADYEETIPIAANAIVKLDVQDDNDHLIDNTTSTAPGGKVISFAGIPGSMNSGQFVQVELVSATKQ